MILSKYWEYSGGFCLQFRKGLQSVNIVGGASHIGDKDRLPLVDFSF